MKKPQQMTESLQKEKQVMLHKGVKSLISTALKFDEQNITDDLK